MLTSYRSANPTEKPIRPYKQSPLSGLGTISRHIIAWNETHDATEDSGAVATVSKESFATGIDQGLPVGTEA